MATLANRNNNPGNLRFVGQKNAQQGQGGFASFQSPQEGYAGLLNYLQIKINKNPDWTLADFSKIYAPAGDNNNTAQYTANLANKLKVRPDTKISELQPRIGEFANAISSNEGYASQSSQKISQPSSNVPYGYVKPPEIQSNLTAPAIDNIANTNSGQNEGLMQKLLKGASGVGEALGMGGLGKGIAGTIFQYTPEGKQAMADLQSGKITKQQYDDIVSGINPSNKEVIASAGQTALNIASAGLPSVKGATAAARIGQGALQGGALGGLYGGLQAYGQDKGTGDIAKQAGTNALFGGALGGATQSLTELAMWASKSTALENAYNKAIGVSSKAIAKGKSPAGTLINEGVIGTSQQIMEKSNAIANSAGDDITKIIYEKQPQFNAADVIQNIENNLKRQLKGGSISDAEIINIVDDLPIDNLKKALVSKEGTIDGMALNDLRSEIDNKYLGSTKWLNDAKTMKVIALKTATNTMREMVQSTDNRLPGLFQKYSDAIIARKSLNSELAKRHMMTNLIELALAGGVGLGSGGSITDKAKNIAGTYIGAKAFMHGLPLVTSGLAVGANKIPALLNSTLGQIINKTGTLGLQNMIKNALSQK